MRDKYDLYPRPRVWRAIYTNGPTYLVPVDVFNPGDHIHVDTHNPKSEGYGGSTLKFTLENGEVYMAKGPWHTNTGDLLKATGINLLETHATMVVIWTTKKELYTSKDYIKDAGGRLHWQDVTRDIDVPDEIVYEEHQPVLGDFYRGERVAHQLCRLLNKPLKYRSESYGGASEQTLYPDKLQLHRLATEFRDAYN